MSTLLTALSAIVILAVASGVYGSFTSRRRMHALRRGTDYQPPWIANVLLAVVSGLACAWVSISWSKPEHPWLTLLLWLVIWTPLFYWFGLRRITARRE
ncbi:hypothetical protein AB0C01_19460 [Micromonospora sp. NPDC048905]|uniref:hypothetical protein n=1 Tax=Micromonospora sp. NPDC048905 TaxID=3155494 RepID=UPI0034012ACE